MGLETTRSHGNWNQAWLEVMNTRILVACLWCFSAIDVVSTWIQPKFLFNHFFICLADLSVLHCLLNSELSSVTPLPHKVDISAREMKIIDGKYRCFYFTRTQAWSSHRKKFGILHPSWGDNPVLTIPRLVKRTVGTLFDKAQWKTTRCFFYSTLFVHCLWGGCQRTVCSACGLYMLTSNE